MAAVVTRLGDACPVRMPLAARSFDLFRGDCVVATVDEVRAEHVECCEHVEPCGRGGARNATVEVARPHGADDVEWAAHGYEPGHARHAGWGRLPRREQRIEG